MGMDLDLAVSHPESGFDEHYRLSFAAMVARAGAALGEIGVTLPEERPLPARFRFRIGVGAYSTASALLRNIDGFVEHLRRERTLPGMASPAPSGGEAAPEVLRPLESVDHLAFGLGTLFVPVDLAAPIRASSGGETMWIASAVRAFAALRVIHDLTHLDESNVWDYRELFSQEPGEPFHGYRFFSKGFPTYDGLSGVNRLLEAAQCSIEYRVCFTVS